MERTRSHDKQDILYVNKFLKQNFTTENIDEFCRNLTLLFNSLVGNFIFFLNQLGGSIQLNINHQMHLQENFIS